MEEYFGQRPDVTVKALVMFMDDELAGVMGLARERGYGRFFSDHKDQLQPYLNSIPVMRCVKEVMRFVIECPLAVYSLATHDEGCRILERLGFTPIGDKRYIWLTGE